MASELVEILKEFYNGLLADLDAGKVIIADGKITKAAEPAPEGEDADAEDAEPPDEGADYEFNKLSPMDKYAVAQYLEGNTYPNPFLISELGDLELLQPGPGELVGTLQRLGRRGHPDQRAGSRSPSTRATSRSSSPLPDQKGL